MTTQPEREPLRGELHPTQLLGAHPDAPPSTTETVRGGRRLGTQPERLQHLLDRLLRGVILPAEAEQLASLVRELEAHLNTEAGVARGNLRVARDAMAATNAAEARIRALAAEVARLTAGQCTHTRAMCEQHHLPPVAGCPYPRCLAATATGRAPTA
ncbi:hypothetical protein [Streptomyces cyaneofuscatus]|uniref:hypothetical protein n=1 Tax=Streptomyces cyaneofuscatus TaxID=66883 RepID=UPI00362DBF6D